MRRCYYCNAKKNDDNILCEKCTKDLEERLKKKKDDKKNDELRENNKSKEESAFRKKARYAMRESAYLDQGITQC